VRRFDDYSAKLEAAKVVLDPQAPQGHHPAPTPSNWRSRRALNWSRTRPARRGRGSGRMAGGADGLVRPAFLSIPGEVIRATIRNQPEMLRAARSQTAKLVNKFILVANIEASDGGKAIVAGNERVIRARLSDAKFFYETDLKTKLEDRLPKFEQIVFPREAGHAGRAHQRIERLATELAPLGRR
jgi:glycyl-tRNA synthetase beta chain